MERNNKYVRGKKKAREEIERYVFHRYNMKKRDAKGWEYELTISYETDEELDQIIYEILSEASGHADDRHCFIEANVIALDGSDRSW